ncbi:MAG: PD40 domain-containing protein, partial [Rhodothermia bacterium]|nr:PD40 domain-containing protein [Rhodothermia bacterium]
LLLYDMTDGSIRRIVEDADVRINRFSPDGRWLAFEQDASGLSIVRIPDGSPARLADVGETPTWIDNEWVMYRNEDRVERISRVTQNSEILWRPPDTSLVIEHPEVLPGGSHALVSVIKDRERSVGVLELESGRIEYLQPNGIAARYVGSGHIIFTEQASHTTSYRGDVYAQPFDLKTMSTRGPAVLVLSERGYWELGMNSRGDLVTTGGVANSFAQPQMALSRLKPETGELSPLRSPVNTNGGLSVSDDGEWLLYMSPPETIPVIGLLHQGRMSPLPQAVAPAFAPLFGHNGEFVFYTRGTPGTGTRIYRQPADGSSPPEPIQLGLDSFEILLDVVDNDQLGIVSAFPRGSDLGALEIVDLNELVSIRTVPGLKVASANVSPDGKWIVFDNAWVEQAGRGVYAVGIDGRGPWLLGAQYTRPLWASNGREVYVVANDQLLAVPVSTTRGVRVSGPERLLYNASPYFDFTVDPSTGDIIIVDRMGGSETLDQIDLVLNWDERLKELVPRQ